MQTAPPQSQARAATNSKGSQRGLSSATYLHLGLFPARLSHRAPGEPRDSAVTPPLQRHYSSAHCRPRRDPVAEWPPGAASLAVTYIRERLRASTSTRPLYTPLSSSLCHAPSAFVAGLHVRPFAPLSAHAGAATRRPAHVSLQLLLRSPRHSRAAENDPGVPLIRARQTRARQHRRIWQ
ncbi:hypothetical protein NDU88_002730 [Pleurodeles waltl]|uniref:Uncharacterized protein n=1 Tax=Pleurodeles waltl TaxID=8319 RepID=A0AAV7PAV1_PLEWA|nr:hypothetical protein NDU88_002730 [Pleurodeles waltl]